MLAGKTDYTVKAGSHEARASRELTANTPIFMPFARIISPRIRQAPRACSRPFDEPSEGCPHRLKQALHCTRGVDRTLHRKEMAAFHPFEILTRDAPRHAEPDLPHFTRMRPRD